MKKLLIIILSIGSLVSKGQGVLGFDATGITGKKFTILSTGPVGDSIDHFAVRDVKAKADTLPEGPEYSYLPLLNNMNNPLNLDSVIRYDTVKGYIQYYQLIDSRVVKIEGEALAIYEVKHGLEYPTYPHDQFFTSAIYISPKIIEVKELKEIWVEGIRTPGEYFKFDSSKKHEFIPYDDILKNDVQELVKINHK